MGLSRQTIFLGVLAFCVLFSSGASAAPSTSTNSTCLTSSISETNSTIVTSFNNIQNVTIISEPKICPFGCNGLTGFCNESKSADSGLGASLIPMLFALGLFGIGMMWKVMKPWDVVYRIIFIFFGLFFAMSSIAVSNSFLSVTTDISSAVGQITQNNVANSTILLWILIGTLIFLTTVELIWTYFDSLKKGKEKQENGED